MSNKLTDSLRIKVANLAVAYRFKSEQDALRTETHTLAQDIYEFTYDKKLRDVFAALPDGVAVTSYDVWFRLPDKDYTCRISAANSLPIAVVAQYGGESLFIKVLSAPLAKRYRALLKREGTIKAKTRETYQQVVGTLAAFSSVQRLLKEWPEIEPFLPPELTTPSSKLPVPQVKKLNKVLGLPVPTLAPEAVAVAA